jgi:RNA polymerase sigma-70 factor (ECF subfamily)
MSHTDDIARPVNDEVVRHLVQNHKRFLAFLERRVESRAAAEEILQSAFVRALEKGGALQDGEGAVTWFYRLLRNALVDHYRRRGVEAKALAALAHEGAPPAELESELERAICQCVRDLLPTLKPDYADLLRKVDLEDQRISDVATAQGITANNAMVKLHRARQALKRQLERSCGTCSTHGCLDCSCGS